MNELFEQINKHNIFKNLYKTKVIFKIITEEKDVKTLSYIFSNHKKYYILSISTIMEVFNEIECFPFCTDSESKYSIYFINKDLQKSGNRQELLADCLNLSVEYVNIDKEDLIFPGFAILYNPVSTVGASIIIDKLNNSRISVDEYNQIAMNGYIMSQENIKSSQ